MSKENLLHENLLRPLPPLSLFAFFSFYPALSENGGILFQIDDEDGIWARRKKQKKDSKEGAELKGVEVS
jgi:hypothetical protein